MYSTQKPKVGLALGSGAAKGLAHIGVIKVLEKHGIPIDFIAGSSIGALIGGIYAATKDIAYVEEIALNTNWREMVKMIDPAFGNGVIAGDKVEKEIRGWIKHKSFDNVQIPFTAVATDIKAGMPVIFRDGDMGKAIRASVSMPFVFHTVKEDGMILNDGGLSVPIPAGVAREMGAEYVIAVDLDSDYFTDRKEIGASLSEMGHDIVMLLSVHLGRENVKDADFVLSPAVGDVHWASFFSREKTADIIRRGEMAMEAAIPKLFPEKEKPKTFWEKAVAFFTQKM